MEYQQAHTIEDISGIYDRHVDTVYRISFSFLKNRSDAEDTVQSVFLKLLSCGRTFTSYEHEKAWLIVTTSNMCKNSLKHWWRKNISLEDRQNISAGEQGDNSDVYAAVLELPNKYKTAIYLHYYEGYTTNEIARLTGKPASTIKNHLVEGRAFLRKKLGDDFDE